MKFFKDFSKFEDQTECCAVIEDKTIHYFCKSQLNKIESMQKKYSLTHTCIAVINLKSKYLAELVLLR